MCTFYHGFFVVMAFLPLLLTSSAANAITINTSVDGNYYGYGLLIGNKTATTGTITSNLWNDVVVPTLVSSLPYDQGDASAIASDGGKLYSYATSQGYHGFIGSTGEVFHAQSEWSDIVSGSGKLYFDIRAGKLDLWDTPGNASYSISIVNNGSTIWNSSASFFGTGVTTTGTDLGGGIVLDPSGSSSYYTFGGYAGEVDFSAGTLTYFMDITVDANTRGEAWIGDPLHGGFSGEIEITGPTTSVPEPAAMVLLGCGLVGLAGMRKKLKK